jgi:hypothetical protein
MRCTWLALPMYLEVTIARELAGALPSWFYAGPRAWEPLRWRNTLRLLLAIDLPHRGIIADVETAREWRAAPLAERGALLNELAQVVRDGTDLGVTTVPMHFLARDLAATGAWGSPQLYGRTVSIARAVAAVRAQGWRELAPSIAAFGRSAYAQARYLRSLPAMRSAIVWAGPYGPPRPVQEVIARWDPPSRPPASSRRRPPAPASPSRSLRSPRALR